MEPISRTLRELRADKEIREMQRAHAYFRRDELLNKRVEPRLENLRGKFVARADRDIREHEARLDLLDAQIDAAM